MKRIAYLFLFTLALGMSACKKDSDKSGDIENRTVNILDYGAVADGKTDNTKAIQAAIDDAARTSGTIVIPEGVFITGPIFLKSNTTLNVEKDAVLKGIANMDIYFNAFYPNVFGSISSSVAPYTPALIFADNAQNVKITGEGTIDGSGDDPAFPQENNAKRRPKIIMMINCKNVIVEGVTLRNSAFWVQHYLLCDGVSIRNVNVYSHGNWNNDGIDIDSKNVSVENCHFDVDDDAICIKSDLPIICEDVVVKNCTVKTNCNAIKLGTSGFGGFRNIDISDISITKASEDRFRKWQTSLRWAGISKSITSLTGIALESVDGGILDNVKISGITMEDVQTPIFIRLGDRSRTYSGRVSQIKSITISDVTAKSESLITNSITGVSLGTDNFYADSIILRNIKMTVLGGGNTSQARLSVPEVHDQYPENNMFGNVLPASGFYVRHVKNIVFENVSITQQNDDARPYYYFNDVKGASLKNSTPQSVTEALFIRQISTEDLTVDGEIYDKGKEDPATPPDDPGTIGADGTFTVGTNTYKTMVYGNLRWMVTNSREGISSATTYSGKAEGENGYYYDADNKVNAVPPGWRLPTFEEAQALKAIIDANPNSEGAQYWRSAAGGAYAGINSGSWTLWGEQGVWRLADKADGKKTATLTSNKGVLAVEDGSTKTPRWFSVRCVQAP